MKIFKYFLLTAALVFFVSCSKDDDNPGTDSSMVLGEWNLEEFSYSGSTTATQGDQTVSSTYTGEAYDLDARVIFNSATNYSTEGSYTIKLTTTVNGQTMVQDYPYSDISGSGTYRVEGNKLITTSNAPPDPGLVDPMATAEGTIVELTANRMVLFAEQVVNSTMQGAEVEIRNETLQVFSR